MLTHAERKLIKLVYESEIDKVFDKKKNTRIEHTGKLKRISYKRFMELAIEQIEEQKQYANIMLIIMPVFQFFCISNLNPLVL